jgi:26S proteasome non-ATPase regulatory subunit 9
MVNFGRVYKCRYQKTRTLHVTFCTTMGFTLPSPTSPSEQVRSLMSRKENIESEINTHLDVLASNKSTLNSPLVDGQGFPRDDIDVYAVRNARVRIIELRNDLKGLMDEIGEALTLVYDPTLGGSNALGSEAAGMSTSSRSPLTPFAKVGSVSPHSPAADAVSVQVGYSVGPWHHL